MTLAWLALSLALVSRRAGDPGFSTSGQGGPVMNWLGAPGAWVADVLLVLFGFSAWWWVLAGGRQLWLGWRAVQRGEVLQPWPRSARLGGLALLLVAS